MKGLNVTLLSFGFDLTKKLALPMKDALSSVNTFLHFLLNDYMLFSRAACEVVQYEYTRGRVTRGRRRRRGPGGGGRHGLSSLPTTTQL